MIPTDYDRELADTIYREVRFNIDAEQFGETEIKSVGPLAWGWLDEQKEARAYAQDMANETQGVVEIGVYGFWGHDCFEYIETIKVQPQGKAA